MIPIQLQKPEFRFVLLGKWDEWETPDGKITLMPEQYEFAAKEKLNPKGKTPFEKDWQNKGYKFDDIKLLKHINNKLNFGIIGGYGNICIVDIDNKELTKQLENDFDTFTVETGTGGKHFYFIMEDKIKNKVLTEKRGEIRAENYQVVCPPCRHPSGNFYKIYVDKPIRKITSNFILGILKPYLRKEVKPFEIREKDTSGSGLEYRRILALIREGKSKEDIFNEMMKYSKWASHGSKYPQYREDTYDNALTFVQQDKQKEEEKREKQEVYDDKDLLDYIPEPQEWLVENQIPKSEVGLLVGKRGERKTFTALHIAICLASGMKVFDVDNVPEKKRVLIIDEETGKNVMAQRINALKKAMGLEKEILPIKFISFSGLKFDRNDKTLQKFYKIMEEFKPDLIIDDCLQRSVTFEVDKDNAAISELFTGIVRPSIIKYGCSWLFIHHMRKSPTINYKPEDPLDEVRGGSELVNYCRFVLMTQSPRHQDKSMESEFIVFKVLKMSNAQIIEPRVISFTSNSGSLKVKYEGIPEEILAGEIRCANAIKEWMFNQSKSEFQTSEFIEANEEIGFKKSIIQAALKVLWDDKFLIKPKKGYWKISPKELNNGQKEL